MKKKKTFGKKVLSKKTQKKNFFWKNIEKNNPIEKKKKKRFGKTKPLANKMTLRKNNRLGEKTSLKKKTFV